MWRTPRTRSLLALGILAGAAAVVAAAARMYTELLWFEELDFEPVFWTTLKWKVLGLAVPGFGTAALLLANLAVVARVVPAPPRVRAFRRIAFTAIAAVGGVVAALARGDDGWRLLALWGGRNDFGAHDPLFGRDVGFYVFSLPLYQEVARWLLETLAMAAVCSAAVYYTARRLHAGRRHLLAIAGLALAVLAWRYWLSQYALALPHGGSSVPGAGYTDVHVRVPARRALAVLALAGGAVCVYAAWRRVRLVPAALVATLALVAAGAESSLPGVIEKLDVQPQELSRQTPYVADAIASTRRAFALDDVDTRVLPANGTLSGKHLTRHRSTIDNLPLWDMDVLRPALNEQQSLAPYYDFPSSTLDVYPIRGRPRLTAVAARQLDRDALAPDVRGWANDRFAYTHGYGAVAIDAGAVGSEGHPRFVERDFGSTGNPLGLTQPRLYFGEEESHDPPYVVVSTGRAEIDKPTSGSRSPEYHYDGDGGIALDRPLRRIAFAARFADLKLLLTETLDDRSRILVHRNVRDRVTTLAPFLRWDAEPQTVVVGGRVQFVFHGYTTSADYPYAAPVSIDERETVNYMRAPALATVDAFDGHVSIYAVEPDEPILRAWQATYPELFVPAERMPADLRSHLRYPLDLYDAQMTAYATYHAGDPTAFWNGSDAWRQPAQLAGPVEGAGEIHFPDVDQRVSAGQMTPDYAYAQLPGDHTERLLLVMPFSPRGRENLVAYLAGTVGDDGRPQLKLLSLPRDRLTLGPSQATRRILSNAGVNRRLELLNRESRDLGEAAVSRTILGSPHIVPIGNSLVHVQPVYLVSGGSGVPRLQLVTAYADGRVGYGRDLEAALRRIVGAGRGR